MNYLHDKGITIVYITHLIAVAVPLYHTTHHCKGIIERLIEASARCDWQYPFFVEPVDDRPRRGKFDARCLS